MRGVALLSSALLGSLLGPQSSNAFVIDLKSEEEFADAADSYPVFLVHLHDPISQESRRQNEEFRRASKLLVPSIQLAQVDRTSQDFQNIVGSAEKLSSNILMYVENERLPDVLHERVLASMDSADDIVKKVSSLSKKMLSGRKYRDANSKPATNPELTPEVKTPVKPKPKPKSKDKHPSGVKDQVAQRSRSPKVKPQAKPKPKPKAKAKSKEKVSNKVEQDIDPILIEPPDSKVAVLDSASFDSFLNSSPLTLVKFYAPWCGHCKRMAPRFTAASVALAREGVALAKIDQTAHRGIGSRYGVSSFPTLLIFEGSQMVKKYDGGRTRDEIIEYMLAFKNGAKTAKWDPSNTQGDPNDPCLKPDHAIHNYGTCCGGGNFEKPGHLPICNQVRDEVKARRRAKQEL